MYADPSGHFPWLLIPLGIGLAAILSGCSSDNETAAPDFEFNANLTYNSTDWNSDTYISNTNCYTYAFNMLVSPATNKLFPEGGMRMTNGYKVALVVNPGADYHWYRMDSDGTWSHKQGQLPNTQDIGYFYDKNNKLNYNNTKITDPKKDAAKLGYTSFVGYYYVKKSKK